MPAQPSHGARELQILALLAEGKSERRIAQHPVISVNTVKTHLKSIYAKAGVHNRDDAADWFRRNITQNG